MAITHVSVTNFRSFKLLDLDLGKFTVFIGANASGKSNVVQMLRFVRDISAHGLPNAVSMQGGTDYLRNVQLGPSIPLHMRIQSDAHGSIAIRGKIDGRSTLLGFRTQATDYSLELTFHRRGLGYTKTLDSAQADCDLFELRPTKAGHLQERRSLGRAHWEAAIQRRRLVVNVTNLPPEVSVESDDLVPAYLRGYRSRLDPLDALIALPPALVFPLQQAFSEIAIYDLDPKLPKRAVPVTGQRALSEDGSNLALVLSHLLETPSARRRLLRLTRDLLPFVDGLDVQHLADRSVLSSMREHFTGSRALPASLMSDGTVNVVALVIALFFQGNGTAVVEEPERNLHPSIIAKLMEVFDAASASRQIMLTTHNPEVVRHAGLERLLLVGRDPDGFSYVRSPATSENVTRFLVGEVGLDDLFVANLLGGSLEQ